MRRFQGKSEEDTILAALLLHDVCEDCKATDAVKPHTPGPKATDKDPQVCTDCGCILVPAKNHTHELTKVPEVKATCAQGGNTEYYTCSGCADLFADAAGKEKIPDPRSVLTGALGHTASDGFDADEDFHWRSCTVCGELLTETRMHHEMENGVCTTCGYREGTTAPEVPQTGTDVKVPDGTKPDADAPQNSAPDSESTRPSGGSLAPEAEKTSSANVVKVLLVCCICFASAVLITAGISNGRRGKKEPKR